VIFLKKKNPLQQPNHFQITLYLEKLSSYLSGEYDASMARFAFSSSAKDKASAEASSRGSSYLEELRRVLSVESINAIENFLL
jgi:hypothetical protein